MLVYPKIPCLFSYLNICWLLISRAFWNWALMKSFEIRTRIKFLADVHLRCCVTGNKRPSWNERNEGKTRKSGSLFTRSIQIKGKFWNVFFTIVFLTEFSRCLDCPICDMRVVIDELFLSFAIGFHAFKIIQKFLRMIGRSIRFHISQSIDSFFWYPWTREWVCVWLCQSLVRACPQPEN